MKLGIIIIVGVIIGVFLMIPSQYNPLTSKGEIVGEFISGGHRGYGDTCGSYPMSWIKMRNVTNYNPKHFLYDKGHNTFYFGSEWKDVDKMNEGVCYRVWYHEESRGSDTTPVHPVYYWVIDGYETM